MRQSLFLALSLSLLFSACSSKTGGGAPLITSNVPADASTTISAPAGSSLDGLELFIPAGAVMQTTTITISNGNASDVTGTTAAGPAATFGPAGLIFVIPAQLRLPFDPSLIATEASIDEVKVQLRDDQTGEIVELIPTSVDIEGGTVLVDVPHFSTCWTSVPFVAPPPSGDDIDVSQYFPLNVGDEYNFDSGGGNFVIAAVTTPLLNVPGAVALVDIFENEEELTYFLRDQNGDLLELGWSDMFDGGGVEEIMNNPIPVFTPATAEAGVIIASSGTFNGYDLPDRTNVSYTGSFDAQSQFTRVVGGMDTPVGFFSDVVRFSRNEQYSASNGDAGTDGFTLFLARGIGPIGLEEAGQTALLISGIVGGQPIIGN